MSHAFVAAAGRVKLGMRMRDEAHAERRLAGKIGDDPRRFIGRAVIGDDDLSRRVRPLQPRSNPSTRRTCHGIWYDVTMIARSGGSIGSLSG